MTTISSLVACLAICTATFAINVEYSLRDLGNVGALHLNNHGDYTGVSYSTFPSHAFVYCADVEHDLALAAGHKSVGMAMNNHGQAVVATRSGSYIWESGELSPVTSGDDRLAVNWINDIGGMAGTLAGQAAVWYGGDVVTLGLPGWGSDAIRINNSNQVIGVYAGYDRNGSFSWSGGDIIEIAGGVMDLNETGQVLGASDGVFVWKDGQYTYLGLPADQYHAADINNSGHIVGSCQSTGQERAFLYADGHSIDLNTAIASQGWLLTSATGVNDAGQIVGTGLFNGEHRGFLLTPVPEPCPAACLLLVLLAMMTARQRTHLIAGLSF